MATCAMRTLAFGLLLAAGSAFRLRRAPATVPLVDITEVVQRKSFATTSYRCCCSKRKGWRDDLRLWVNHTGYCQISETDRCGGYLGVFGAHNYKDTEDGKCEILSSTSFSFGDFYAAHGSPSNYCSADVVFRTPSGEVLVAVASAASLGEEVPYSCPDGWEVPLGKGKLKCEFESPHAGSFTGVNCQKIQEGSGPTPLPTDDQSEDEDRNQDQVGNEDEGKGEDEKLVQDEDEDEDEGHHSGESEDDDEEQHQEQNDDAEQNHDQVEDKDNGGDEDGQHQQNEDDDEKHHPGESADDDDEENQQQNEDSEQNQDNVGDKGEDKDKHHQQGEDDDQKHQHGEDEDEDDERTHDEQNENEASVTQTTTSTPVDTETINKVTEGITEEAKAICKRGHQGEFCCVRQCKKLSEENAKGLASYVKATCVQECSKAWQGANKS